MSGLQVCRRWTLISALVVVVVPKAYGQDPNWAGQTVDYSAQAGKADNAAERDAQAEAIVAAQEAASGREFDRAYRAAAKAELSAKSLKELDAIRSSGRGLGLTPVAASRAQELVYTPLTPCRIIDTRVAGGAIAAGATRSFLVTGTGFTSQGGVAGTCGIPFGAATAAVINFVAVNATAPGDVRVTPFGTAMPLASIINFAGGVAGLNLANGPAVAICNPGVALCTRDITLQADASAIDIVADVQGFFARRDAAVTVDLATNFSQLINASGFVEVMKSTITLPDKCIGVTDGWTVLVSASGYLSSPSATGTLARLGLSLDSATVIQSGTLTNATLGPGDNFNEVWHSQWVFSGIDAGPHDFRTLAEEFNGTHSYTAFWNRMVVQVLGDTCP
jgi:hypothetical protein